MDYRNSALPLQQTQQKAEQSTLQSEIRSGLDMVRRRYPQLLIGMAIGVVALGIYSFTATVYYKATTQITLDPRSLDVLQTTDDRNRVADAPLADSARVDSLVEVLQSPSTVMAVVKKLDLQNDSEFNGTKVTVLSTAIGAVVSLFVGDLGPPSQEEKLNSAISNLKDRQLTVERATGTYVVSVSVQSESPEKAAQIANAFANEYVRSQLNADFQTTQAASSWLKDRASELRAQMLKASALVADYKSAHNIATSDGKSIADIMLADISSKVTEAAAHTAELRAKLDRIEQVTSQEKLDLTVADALTNDVITDLRKKYFDAIDKATNIETRYGAATDAVQKYRSEANTILAAIRSELKRIQETTRSEYQIAAQREKAARDSLSNQFLKTVDVSQDQVYLAQLESGASTAQLVYEDTLKRYTETVQKESFPVITARIIAQAVPPTERFKPKRAILIAIGAAVGLIGGFGYSLVSELYDRRIRTKIQAEKAVGTDCLGTFPMLGGRSVIAPISFMAHGRKANKNGIPWDYVVQEPFSVGAEAMRSVKIALDHGPDGQHRKILGVVSSLPQEGKSTIAANLAHLLGDSGSKVLLVDADIRRSALSHRLLHGATEGLPDCMVSGADYKKLIRSEPSLNLDFLPASTKLKIKHSHELLGSKQMEMFLSDAAKEYDYIVLDLPPIIPVVDARTIAPYVDGFLFVAAWGETLHDVTVTALDSAPQIREKLVGMILNKVRLNQLKRYGEYAATYYSAAYHND